MKGIELKASEGKALKRINAEGIAEYCRGGHFPEEIASEYTECPIAEYEQWKAEQEERLEQELEA